MALTDPQQLTFDGNVNSLPLIERNKRSSVYKTSNDALTLSIDHIRTKAGRVQHKVNSRYAKMVTNPLDNSKDFDDQTLYITFDRPLAGFSLDDMIDHVNMIKTWLTDAKTAQLFAEES